jgi:hypothetical protein
MKKNLFFLVMVSCIVAIGITGFKKIHGQVACFGDSITYVAQVDGHSWVYFLSQKHQEIDFVNSGRR